ncbi:MAG: TetR/AcrR family transcriptional regulator [bacterium]|nr:TetR/AcrR family transcriptional regulator [bacterium]
MGKSEKQIKKENDRLKRILDAAYDIFVEKKIEAVSMNEIADAAGIGRATLFRCYASKADLVIAVNAAKWKEILDELDEIRPVRTVGDISAIDRFTFTLDGYIYLYRNRKDILQFNDNFNHYITHECCDDKQLEVFYDALYSVDMRFHLMYEKAKEDHTFRTDIPEDEFFRATLHLMMASCAHYAGGFIWGSQADRDYTPELLRQKEMILSYIKG